MSSRHQRMSLLLALGLILGVMAGTASAAPEARASATISGTVYSPDLACASAHATGTVLVDAYDTTTKDRYGSAFADASGNYTLSGLPTGDYKLRFRHVTDEAELDTYWWYESTKAEPRALTFETGTTVSVTAGFVTTINACPPTFTGGTFKGTITPVPAGIDIACMSITAFEASSGIGVGLTDVIDDATGAYRFQTDLPPGQYRALAWQYYGPNPPCNVVPEQLLDQWWKGHSGPDYFAMSNARHWDSGKTFTIGVGTVTGGIHFPLMPIGTCDGQVPTILGSTGDDVIVGTNGPDVIMLYDGDDEAHGGKGKDTICGGKGEDNLFGDDKRDRIFGGRHDDYLTGGDGPDLIVGGLGLDQMFGGLGNDKLKGGDGGDLIHGDEDNDILNGNKGDDNLFGGSGTDTLRGGPGNDNGDGGTGVDICNPDIESLIDCP